MKKILSLIFISLSFLMVACDSVDEGKRYIYVPPTTVGRNVLIEDFTGQKCKNCPEAHEEIERLQHQYGADTVIAVSIHSGPLAVFPTGSVVGLRTQVGDEYYKYWNIESEPTGMVDRVGGITNRFEWAGLVATELKKAAPVQLEINNHYDQATRALKIDIQAVCIEDFKGKLQLWLTEDNISCTQMMSDGKPKKDYIQNNVLRAAVNGTWGTDFALTKGQSASSSFETQIDGAWSPKNVAVVAFVYNDKGVQQVTRKSIK